MNHKYFVAFAVVIGIVLLSLVLSSPFSKLENEITGLRYELRGQAPADSNIVLLYFDEDDIAKLKNWPLPRSYYALLLDVLTKNNVRAIGIETFFGEPNLQFPEYDHLLQTTIERSGKTVLTCYFSKVSDTELKNTDGLESLAYLKGLDRGRWGNPLFKPLDSLVHRAAGIGHVNLAEERSDRIPLYLRYGNGAVPSFALEVLRIYFGAQRSDLFLDDGILSIRTSEGVKKLSPDNSGTVTLNIPGSLDSFRKLRCVEVMRSYELQKYGLTPTIDLSILQGKIVLVGVIAKGRGVPFYITPFTEQFPSLGLHATFVHNGLQGSFLQRFPLWLESIITLLLGSLCTILLLRWKTITALLGSVIVVLIYLAVSHTAFATSWLVLPMVQPMFVVLFVMIGGLTYYFIGARDRVSLLEHEKNSIESELRARELKLQTLEKELLNHSSPDQSGRGTELLDEIRRYKQDIKTLSAQVSDLVKYDAVEVEQQNEKAEFEGLIYHTSGKMKEIVSLVQKLSSSDANVLILGESGTGKELVAHAIHNLSTRKQKAFIAVNCGALTESLLESELFGHEKGSFTGAIKDKMGRFESADGGTIFLDEIAETSESFQVKLLRVVQYGEFERVGSNVTKKVNTRIIAATNKNVKELMDAKRFREDLYYRLNVFSVELPPLRDRKTDISLLAEFFVRREAAGLSLSTTVMDSFLQYRWPGNVRELESTIKRAVIFARSEKRTLLQLRDLPEQIANAIKGQVDLADQILESLRVKKFSRSSISETAEELGGMHRGTVAEYFRGLCFQFFFENLWDHERTVRAISKSEDAETNDRVRKKLSEYLANVVEGIPIDLPLEELKLTLKSKYKNLPQRYHTILDEVLRAYLSRQWTTEDHR
ncbi:MAG: sigma 54-interacting transcriptional regulator [bacterium]